MVIQGGSRERRRFRRGAATGALVLSMLLACDGDSVRSGDTPSGASAPASAGGTDPRAGHDPTMRGEAWIAKVDGAVLTRAELEAPLAIALHDLEIASHRLRRERLDAWIAEQSGGAGSGARSEGPAIEDRLRAPEAPRFSLPPSDARMAGPEDAPVVVTQFVDFASSHSRRLQPVLAHVLALEPDRVRVEDRQLPLAYHRFARDAAEASLCARAQDAYAPYAEVLLLEQAALTAPDLRRYAERIGLDLVAFDACLDEGASVAPVSRDLALAASIGVTRAATVFVNGRYVAGRPDAATLAAVVAEELGRIGLEPRADRDAPALERWASSPAPSDGSGPPPVPAALFDDPEFVVNLSRADVLGALEDARALDGAFEATGAEFGGERLLKLRRVERDGFYDRLGFEAGDVLLAVDGEYVTATRNPLFEALAGGDAVRVIVMRRGRPRRFEYRVGEGR